MNTSKRILHKFGTGLKIIQRAGRKFYKGSNKAGVWKSTKFALGRGILLNEYEEKCKTVLNMPGPVLLSFKHSFKNLEDSKTLL